jgi:hypothetical protein
MVSAVLRKMPSAGFVAIVLTHLGLAAFLAWGFRQPPLERVWELHHELKIGKVGKLKEKDHALLDAALVRHHELAEALLERGSIGLISAHENGWLETSAATVLRTSASTHPCQLVLDVKIPEDALPMGVEVSGPGWNEKRSIKRQGLSELTLPKPSGQPEIITLEVSPQGADEDVITLGVRVTFSCSQAGGARQ